MESRHADERAQMNSMAIPFATCEILPNRALIDQDAVWITHDAAQQQRDGAAGVEALFCMLAVTTSGHATELHREMTLGRHSR